MTWRDWAVHDRIKAQVERENAERLAARKAEGAEQGAHLSDDLVPAGLARFGIIAAAFTSAPVGFGDWTRIR